VKNIHMSDIQKVILVRTGQATAAAVAGLAAGVFILLLMRLAFMLLESIAIKTGFFTGL
jgi:hypothetical protein